MMMGINSNSSSINVNQLTSYSSVNMWFLVQEDNQLFLNRHGETPVLVNGIREGKRFFHVDVLLKDETLSLNVREFDSKKCFPKQNQVGECKSRSKFVQAWSKYVAKNDWIASDGECDVSDSSIEPRASTPAHGINLNQDQCIGDKLLGVYDVHIDNLVAPENCRATRHVDPHHVGFLADSFSETKMGQLVVLQGMVLDKDVDPATLHQRGAGKVECLGGNHTRQALQALYHEGRWAKDTVKVNVYQDLSREAALSLGYMHNVVLHERKKTVSFLDKVRMMRHLRPDERMTASQLKAWKDSLIVVFRAKDRRRLQQSFPHHLAMAQLSEDLWQNVLRATQLVDVTERFFKAMMRVSQEHIGKCLAVLEEKGTKAFNAKVQEYIAKKKVGQDQSKEKTTSLPPTAVEEVLDGDEELFDDVDLFESPEVVVDYKLKYEDLLVEHETLKKELENVKKRKREADNFDVGDEVEAKWIEKGKMMWLPAKVIAKYCTLEVQWACDKKVSEIRPVHVRRV